MLSEEKLRQLEQELERVREQAQEEERNLRQLRERAQNEQDSLNRLLLRIAVIEKKFESLRREFDGG